MDPLEPPDCHHLNAALGWLGLDCAEEAGAALGQISPGQREHPAVLATWWSLRAHECDWAGAVQAAEAELARSPGEADGWLHRAYALRRAPGGGLARAWEALLPAAAKFPSEPVIAYNLSCYACQLSQLDTARHWLRRAARAGSKSAIKKMARADADLQPLWSELDDL